MSGRVIKCNLSQKSIRNAIKELKTYQNSLRDKNELFLKRLCELGIPVIDENIVLAQGDSDRNHNTYIKINRFGNYAQATLVEKRFADSFKKGRVHMEAAYAGNREEAEEWAEIVKEEYPQLDFHMDPLSLSVACHIGYGALAIACSVYLPEDK